MILAVHQVFSAVDQICFAVDQGFAVDLAFLAVDLCRFSKDPFFELSGALQSVKTMGTRPFSRD